jgi:hypothetical protein
MVGMKQGGFKMDDILSNNDQGEKDKKAGDYAALYGQFLPEGKELTEEQRERFDRAMAISFQRGRGERAAREKEERNELLASKQGLEEQHQEILWRRAVLKAADTMSKNGEATPPDFKATFGIEPTEAQIKLWENETIQHAEFYTSTRTDLTNDRPSDYANRKDFDYLPRHFRPHRPSQTRNSRYLTRER